MNQPWEIETMRYVPRIHAATTHLAPAFNLTDSLVTPPFSYPPTPEQHFAYTLANFAEMQRWLSINCSIMSAYYGRRVAWWGSPVS
jgi:hypothetical protein